MKDNIITICKNDIYFKRFIHLNKSTHFNTFTLFEFISNELSNYYLSSNKVSKKIINKLEEYIILEEIISDEIVGYGNQFLHDIDSLVFFVQNAIKNIHEYDIDFEDGSFNLSVENKFLWSVMDRYNKYLNENDLFTYHQAINFFIKNIEFDNKVQLIGFNLDTPLNQLIQDKFKTLKSNSLKKDNDDYIIQQFDNELQEFNCISDEIIRKHLQGEKIAIISEDVNKIVTTFYPTLTSLQTYNKEANGQEPIRLNVPNQTALSKSPIIRSIFTFFDLHFGYYVSVEKIRHFVVTCFQIDLFLVSDLDQKIKMLKRHGVKKINLKKFNEIIESTPLNKSCFEEIVKLQSNLAIADWGTYLAKILESNLFWSELKINDALVEDLSSFINLINKFNSVRKHKIINYLEFKKYLNIILNQTQKNFFLSSNTIDIYSLDDEVISHYDTIYLIDFIDRKNQSSLRNPLLPFYHLKKINDFNKRKVFIQNQLNKLSEKGNLSISYSLLTDNIENTIASSVSFKEVVKKKYSKDYDFLHENKTLSLDNDHTGKTLPKEIKNIRGLLERLQICPRWAFYEDVLQCKDESNHLTEEYSPRLRGILIHEALHTIWKKLKNFKNLNKIDNLGEFIRPILEMCLEAKYEFSIMGDSVKKFEIEKCTALIQELLKIEKKRFSFSIQSLELKQQFIHGEYVFDLIKDRVDKDDKGIHIIDYKTGKLPTAKSWTDVPIKNFQIPLYFLFSDSDVSSLLLYEINQKKIAIKRFTFKEKEQQMADDIPQQFINKSYMDLKKIWLDEINSLMQLYKQGYFPNSFDKEEDLTYCGNKILLRLPEKKYQYEL